MQDYCGVRASHIDEVGLGPYTTAGSHYNLYEGSQNMLKGRVPGTYQEKLPHLTSEEMGPGEGIQFIAFLGE